MSLSLFQAPTAEPTSLADVKAHLRIDGATEDATLLMYLRAAAKHLEGPDGWLGRAFITQTWDWTFDAFPCYSGYSYDYYRHAALVVPLAPLQSVTSIQYVDGAGATQTLSSALYAVDTASDPGRVTPIFGQTWPVARYQSNAVTVRFIAGYGNGAAAVPEPIRTALMGLTAHFYTNRDVDGSMPGWVDALLGSYRVYRCAA